MTKKTKEVTTDGEWETVAQYPSSSGSAIHTVSKNDNGDVRCTCQSFRIRKTGACKHTIKYQETQ